LRKVLIADDSPVARDVVSKRLIASGLETLSCVSSADARVRDPAELSCALLDIDLGDGDGTMVAADLRAACPELPIAFFSGSAAPEVAERARALGPVFAKPDELESAIASVRSHAR
jgi:two-component system sensor histidine kinase HydH